jgi:hypothetical protein
MPDDTKKKPWVDKREEVNGPGLHALIIGVSDYQFLPVQGQFPDLKKVTLGLTKVNIPATGAYRVANWFKTSYWHPTVRVKTVRLLLSPSADEMAQKEFPELAEFAKKDPASAAPSQTRAITSEVWQAMLDWQEDCRGHPDDIAVMYVAGHGVQWGSKDDAIVLLEDFSKDPSFMDYAIDVGGTMKGMSGADMPQSQFYFVDACRIMPEEFGKQIYSGKPRMLPIDSTGEDLRAAPIYYGACPQTQAKGHRGRGTYFAEALVDCLDNGQQGPIANSTLPVAQSYWHISVASLLTVLQDRVTLFAKPDGEKQEVVMGGNARAAVLSARETPPAVCVVVEVSPDEAAQVAFAELWNELHEDKIRERQACIPKPLQMQDVAPGVYTLDIVATAPYRGKSISVVAQPPQWKKPISI